MNKISGYIVKNYKLIIAFFAVLVVVCGFLATKVKVNYVLSDYLPDETESATAVKVLKEEFDEVLPNVEFALPDVTISEALAAKAVLQKEPYVDKVMWLDDMLSLAVPLELQDKKTLEGFYKDRTARFQVTVHQDAEAVKVTRKLQSLFDGRGLVRGSVVETARAQTSVQQEMLTILMFAIPFALLVLILSTNSWFEPVLFLGVILVGVALNFGTNIFLHEISFITQSVGAVLQLAVSMDFAIFFLHRVIYYRNEGHALPEAVRLAIVKSLQPIGASAVTTICGFLVLALMRFKLGPDLGIVLAKGVFFSLVSVFLLLPALIILLHKLLEKTTHRSFLPSFDKFGKFLPKIRWFIIVFVAIILVPIFLAQRSNNFLYGMGSFPKNSREYKDNAVIDKIFGDNLQMAFLVPKGEYAVTSNFVKSLQSMPEVNSVISYETEVGSFIPRDILSESQRRQLFSDNYTRLFVSCKYPNEGDKTFALSEKLRDLTDTAYGKGQTHLVGANFILLDMKNTVKQDNFVVNVLAILAVGLVIMIAFKSLSLPILLVLTIEISIWLNLSIPYFQDASLNFIGYLVISTMQLGATVDYGILLSQHYMDNRKRFETKIAAQKAVSEVVASILTPALILSGAGFALNFISSNAIVSELGLVLGRGALLSLFMVVFLLPNLLYLFDRLIEKTTKNTNFLGGKKHAKALEK